MAMPPTPPRGLRSALPGGKRLVVRGLLSGLLRGEWEGGARLTEAEAVARFGVSRTPVREALLELQGMGFVELRRHCGAVFLPFGPGELREIYAVRSLLEVEAARLAAGRLPESVLAPLVAAFTGLRESGAADPEWENDRVLHRVVAEASGNRRLFAEIARYGDVVQTVREIVGGQDYGIHETTADEHLDILAALARNDAAGAAAAMAAHLAQASQSAADAVRRLRAAEPPTPAQAP
jgi:DNA-binding GntR family transcriptional regulator